MTKQLTVSEIMAVAKVFHQSNFFKAINVEQIATLMFLAQEEGHNPIIAIKEHHILYDRANNCYTPTLKSDAMLARFAAAGGKVKWIARTDDEVTGEFTPPPNSVVQEPITITWNSQTVANAQLAGKDFSNHRKYPRAMKTARVIAEAVRLITPQIIQGNYASEELIDENNFVDIEKNKQLSYDDINLEAHTKIESKVIDTSKIISAFADIGIDEKTIIGKLNIAEIDDIAVEQYEYLKKQYSELKKSTDIEKAIWSGKEKTIKLFNDKTLEFKELLGVAIKNKTLDDDDLIQIQKTFQEHHDWLTSFFVSEQDFNNEEDTMRVRDRLSDIVNLSAVLQNGEE